MAAAREPQTHALIVAVSEFSDPALAPYALQGAERDAQAMATAFAAFAGADAHAIVLTGAAATLPAVESEFARLRATVAPGDRVMLYFSAHGSRIPDNGEIDESDGHDEVLLLADAGEWDGKRLPGALVDDDLAAAIRALRGAGADVFLVIDSCASGGAQRSGPGTGNGSGSSSGSDSGSGSGQRVRTLPPDILAVPDRAMRSALRRDEAWVEDDMPAGSGRLVTFAAAPTYAAAWDTPDGGPFTQSLAAALADQPVDFVNLAQEQRRLRSQSPMPGPRSEIGGAVESAFFFAGALPDLVAMATDLPRPDWTLGMHAAAQANCDTARIGTPRELDPAALQKLAHCDAVMLAVAADEPGYFDAWYVDSAGQRTLLSPIGGAYLDGREPAHLSFTFVAQDPVSGAPFPAGIDRVVLLRKTRQGDHDGAIVIEIAVAPEP